MPGGPVRAQNPQHPGRAVELLVVRQAARRWKISTATLWGVYGTETGFGSNIKESSAGAQGPFQFMPGTAKQYGVNVLDFTSSAFGAAHYLHDSGANTDPDSAATHKALNTYSGGGGQDYINKVKSNGENAGPQNPVSDAARTVGDAASGAVDLASAIPDFLGKLNVIFQPHWWLRVGMILGGIIALAAGIIFVGKDFTPIGAVTKLAKGKV